ncbi:DUF1775 domain-containing protein [Shimia sp.]|uniref:YcnI family copper-binding membrane protein n=1 Tax=Shimia sp. TaxID=1954381 RepID=UPI0032995F1C
MKLTSVLSAAFGAALLATSAIAHATLEQQEAETGSYYKAVFRIGHGCSGEATLKVRVTIPEGVVSVKPMPKPGWGLETVTGAYEHTYDLHGTDVSEGVKEVVWTGELADAHYDEFVFRAKLDGSLTPDEMLFFPTVQECANEDNAWVEIPAKGQNAHDLDKPAPGLMLSTPHKHNH